MFWSGGKRCPKVINFNYQDANHLLFVSSCTHLLARCFGIKDNFNTEELIEVIKDYHSPEYLVIEEKTATTDEEAKEQNDSNLVEVSEKIDQLVQQDSQFLNNCVFNPQEFEKDDDTNWHIAYLTATSNCRSQSYGIALLDHYQVRGMAGK